MELSFNSGRFVSLDGDLNYREVLDDFPTAKTIRIITYNISKNQRYDALLDALKNTDADVHLITNVPSRMDKYYDTNAGHNMRSTARKNIRHELCERQIRICGGLVIVAKHEFGIMQKEPLVNERYDTYVPQKYNCIAVDDDFIEPIMMELQSVDCYWHTLKREEKGLAYCGITIIPPKSMEVLISILLFQNKKEFASLISLANQAKENGKYIIHYGI